MSRRVREWPVYKDMEERVANMATVLPLVNNLHSPAMRDRHWRSLIQVTKKPFEKGPSFALQVRAPACMLQQPVLDLPTTKRD